MPMENSNKFSISLMELGSVSDSRLPVAPVYDEWHQPSTLNHLLLQLSTQNFQLLLLTLLKLQRPRLLILLLLKKPKLLLQILPREKDVRLILVLLMDLE